MITEIGITGEEVAVEVWTGMNVTGIVEGTETIVGEAGAAVRALFTQEAVEEDAMMMSGGVLVVQEVPHLLGAAQVLEGVLLREKLLLLGVKVLTDVDVLLVLEVFLLEVGLLILEVHLLGIQMLMNDAWWLYGVHGCYKWRICCCRVPVKEIVRAISSIVLIGKD